MKLMSLSQMIPLTVEAELEVKVKRVVIVENCSSVLDTSPTYNYPPNNITSS